VPFTKQLGKTLFFARNHLGNLVWLESFVAWKIFKPALLLKPLRLRQGPRNVLLDVIILLPLEPVEMEFVFHQLYH
jgi:hypothetical protein